MEEKRNKRAISLCFLGHDKNPDIDAFVFDELFCDMREKGEKRGRSGTFPKNYLAIWQPIYACEKWSEQIELLVTRFGGWKKLESFIAHLSPSEAWLRIDAPIFGSPYVESNSIDGDTLKRLTNLDFAFDFAVRAFDHTDITHNLSDGSKLEL